MSFKFGVSYNCSIGGYCVGGADDGFSSLDMIGNNLVKICNAIQETENDKDLIFVQKGTLKEGDELVGQYCSMGGKVVAYYGYDYDGNGFVYPTIVIFEDPTSIVVVED